MTGAEVPLRSCCASAALGRVPPVYCEPARPDCARSAAGPSPSSPGAASSAEPSAASGRSDAPPTEERHRQIHQMPTTVVIYTVSSFRCLSAHQLSVLLDDGFQFLFWSVEFVQTLHQQHGFFP